MNEREERNVDGKNGRMSETFSPALHASHSHSQSLLHSPVRDMHDLHAAPGASDACRDETAGDDDPQIFDRQSL